MKVTDPVCGMSIEVEKAHAREDLVGRSFFFCSEQCPRMFLADAERYTSKASAPSATGGSDTAAGERP